MSWSWLLQGEKPLGTLRLPTAYVDEPHPATHALPDATLGQRQRQDGQDAQDGQDEQQTALNRRERPLGTQELPERQIPFLHRLSPFILFILPILFILSKQLRTVASE